MEPVQLAPLRKATVRLLKKSRTVGEHERTALLRELAETLFEVRGHFTTPEGDPDYRGHSFAYRSWVGEACSDAGLMRDETPVVLAAIRYHMGSVLRERLDTETLADLGLIPQTPKERAGDRRQARTAILNALSEKEVGGGALVALAGAQRLLKTVAPEDLAELDPNARGAAEEALAGIERKSRSLRRKLNAG